MDFFGSFVGSFFYRKGISTNNTCIMDDTEIGYLMDIYAFDRENI